MLLWLRVDVVQLLQGAAWNRTLLKSYMTEPGTYGLGAGTAVTQHAQKEMLLVAYW